jgi:hypothetical protein
MDVKLIAVALFDRRFHFLPDRSMTGFYLAGWQLAVTLITHGAWVEAKLAH